MSTANNSEREKESPTMLFVAVVVAAAIVSLVQARAPTVVPVGQPRGKWTPFVPLSDEFNGNKLDGKKWSTDPRVVGWAGRKPGLFSAANVRVENGTLKLFAREAHRNASWPEGFDNFTTAAIHSIAHTSQGYFEVKSRSGSSSISSSFWFHQNDGKGSWTEIDVFESVGGNAPHAVPGMNTTMMCTHTHVFELAGVPRQAIPQKCGCTFGDRVGEKRKSNIGEKSLRPCSIGTCVPMKWGFDDGFHVYGLEWNDTSIVVYADGNQVGDAYDASCFAQKIGMDFDRETMPGWMGTPDLPFAESAPFEIDYVRVWKPSEGDDNILF